MIASPNSLVIDLSALAANLRQVRDLVGRDIRIMGVVKSDAYGHGLLTVAQTLEREGIDCLGVGYLHEAIALREGGVRLPIVILCGIRTREESCQVLEKDLTPVIFDARTAEILSQECHNRRDKARVHLKVDTGMGRLGIAYTDIGQFLQKVIALRNLEIEALTTHLATADEPDGSFTQEQIERFETAISTGRSLGMDLPLNNMANSAGIMRHKKTHFAMVRPGIMLYGALPSPGFAGPALLAPVMHFQAQVVQVRDLPDKTPVSYGRTYYARGPRKAAVLSAGYADGVPRALSNCGKVLVGGREAKIIGTVCMSLTLCDITGIETVRPGDEVVFLGSQGKGAITADAMARDAGTISYEILCAIGRKNTRKYVR
jgi:alanine racemase